MQHRTPVKAVLFDFDGTISTLRFGWENVMKPLMLEMISGGSSWNDALEKEVSDYINESTGIQTIHQMRWLAETVHARGMNPTASTDPWWYKNEYNRRLMENVNARLTALNSGTTPRNEFLIGGSDAFLQALRARSVRMFVASGTDQADVIKEASALGVASYFEQISGALPGSEACSKEKVLAQLMENLGLNGDEFAVIGDGKVEIRLGREAGARTVGLASDEAARYGVNPVKEARLVAAGADMICGDFSDMNTLLHFLGL